MKNLNNKLVFITGASSGIGKACAISFAKKGANILICARRIERLKDLSEFLKKKYKVNVHYFQLDVRKYSDVKKKINSLPAKWKKIDILVNNAGLSRGLNKIQDGVLLDWEEMIDTNIKGLLYVTKEVISLLMKQQTGHIINIGSIAGHEVYPGGNAYCASKHAVDALTNGFRMDLIDTNIRVSTIDPGLVRTEFSIVRYRGDKIKAETAYKGMTPLKPEDIADAVIYAATRNDNVVIAEMIIVPKAQASSTLVKRNL
jgi:NADP-dependent 3-hydroxy acid dehydrogenase YdfG